MNFKTAKKYLTMCQDEDLASHDRKYHPEGYKEGDRCKVRDNLSKGDDADAAVSVVPVVKPSGGGSGSDSAKEDWKKAAEAFRNAKNGEEAKKAADAYRKSLDNLPWSSFGSKDDSVSSFMDKDGVFEMMLMYDADFDPADEAEPHEYDDEPVTSLEDMPFDEIFADGYGPKDKTVGDTYRRALEILNKRCQDEVDECAARRESIQDDMDYKRTVRGEYAYNAPFFAIYG